MVIYQVWARLNIAQLCAFLQLLFHSSAQVAADVSATAIHQHVLLHGSDRCSVSYSGLTARLFGRDLATTFIAKRA